MILGAFLGWIFFYFKRRDLLGGYIGGTVVGILGSVLGVYFISKPAKLIITFLQNGLFITNVDILAGLSGGYLALYVYNRINHDRARKDY